MTRTILTSLVAVALLAACGGEEPPGMPGGSAGDPSTPEGAVRAFCAAAEAKDMAGMGSCIAPDAVERDLLKLRDGTYPADELDATARQLALASVDGVEYGPGKLTAEVAITFESGRKETMSLVKVGEVWLISDF